MHQSVLQKFEQEMLLNSEAKSLKLSVPMVVKTKAIREENAFKDPLGKFSQNKFLQSLKNAGLSEAKYLEMINTEANFKIGIEIRGSSSQMFPKKQFAIETQDNNGNNNNVSILGLPPENDWILYAPYSDKSLIRNYLAYKLARDMGRYSSRTRFCELLVNGDYKGLYIIMEKIKRDDNRIDISKLETDETSGDDLTGGYIIKIDKWSGENNDGWFADLPDEPYTGFYYLYHYPKPDEIVLEQEEYIRAYTVSYTHLTLPTKRIV